MKLSWLFVILLLVFVSVFSVQNAGVITVHFLTWEVQMSGALVILLAAILGGLVGLGFGAWSARTSRAPAKPIENSPTPAQTPRLSTSAPSLSSSPVLSESSSGASIAKPSDKRPTGP